MTASCSATRFISCAINSFCISMIFNNSSHSHIFMLSFFLCRAFRRGVQQALQSIPRPQRPPSPGLLSSPATLPELLRESFPRSQFFAGIFWPASAMLSLRCLLLHLTPAALSDSWLNYSLCKYFTYFCICCTSLYAKLSSRIVIGICNRTA